MTWKYTKLIDEANRQLTKYENCSKATSEEMVQYIIDLENVIDDKRRLTKEIDIVLNGDGAAEQASLCDILAQLTVFAKSVSRTKIFSEAILQLLNVPQPKGSDDG